MHGASVNVLIGEGQPLYRDAVVRSVRQEVGFQVTAEVGDADQALAAIRTLHPDVAVLGLPMDGLDAAHALRAATGEGGSTRVVALVASDAEALVFELIAAGAAGCLSRAVDPAMLVRAIEAAARGDTVVSPELQGGLAREVQLHNRVRGPLLTEREREVLTLVAEGLSRAEIALRLHLSPATVKTHLGHAFEKLGVSDRASAVAAAIRRGLID